MATLKPNIHKTGYSNRNFSYLDTASPFHGRDEAIDAATDLYLAGLGILPARIEADRGLVRYQITPQAERALCACSAVMNLSPYAGTLRGIIPAYVELIDLNEIYDNEAELENSIDAVAEFVTDRAKQARIDGTPVAFVTYGSVLYGDSVSVKVAEDNFAATPEERFRLQAIPGVSSMDTVMADLLVNPADGLQMFDLTTLISMDYVIETRLPVLLIQPDVFEERWTLANADANTPNLKTLRAFLLSKGYPDSHTIYFRHSTTGFSRPSLSPIPVSDLDSLAFVEPATTIFVPGI